MLDDKVREAARRAVMPRFDLLEETLNDQLDELAARAGTVTQADQLARIGVKVRLVCEQDMNERAFAVWRALRRAHETLDGHRTESLLQGLANELHLYMSDASLHLATRLGAHAEALSPTFAGNLPLDAGWIRRLQRLAEEKQMKEMEHYVSHLHRSLSSWVGRHDE